MSYSAGDRVGLFLYIKMLFLLDFLFLVCYNKNTDKTEDIYKHSKRF